MLLEVEARRSVLLRLTGDDAWPTVACVRQMPLVGAAGFAGVFRAAFHVKRVLADELDIASLMALVLRLVAGGHDAADVVLVVAAPLVARGLLVSCDSTADAEVALHIDLLTGARSSVVRSLVVPAELASTVHARRVLGSRVLTLIQLNLLARGPGRRTLISWGVVGQTAVGDSSLVREGSVEVLRLT